MSAESVSPSTNVGKLNDSNLQMIAAKYNKTPAQLLLRWNLQHRVIPLPKSKTISRIEENIKIFNFKISEEDMQELDSLNSGMRYSWDPTNVK